MNLSILRNVGVLASGAVVGQLIGLLTLPILTRLYPPEAFGHYQLYLAATALFGVLPTLRFDYALLSARTDADVEALLDVNLLLTLGFAGLMTLGALAWESLGPGLHLPVLGFSPYLLAPALIVSSLYQYLVQFTIRERAFNLVSWGKVGQAVVFAAVGIGLGLLAANNLGIMFADLAGKIVYVGAACLVFRRVSMRLYNGVSRQALMSAIWRNRQFALVSWPGSLVSILAAFTTPTLIYSAFTAADAGQYAMADRALTLPVAFVVQAVSQAYSADLVQKLRHGAPDIRQSYRRMIGSMALLGAIPTLGVILLAPMLFSVIFGQTWVTAGRIAQIMVAPAYAGLVYGSVNMVLILVGAQKMQAAWELARFVVIALLWIIAQRLHLGLFTIVAFHAAITATLSLLFVGIGDLMIGRRERLEAPAPA